MRFLVLSDMHDDDVFIHQLKDEFQKADGVLFGGDFAKYNFPETAEPALKRLVDCHDAVYAVLGNCDEPAFLQQLEEADISVQGSMVFRDGLVFAGSGGGSKFTGTTPNERSDEELVSDFQIIRDQPASENGENSWDNMIMLMHNPPKDTECDKITSGIHVGSAGLRQIIEETKPLAVITGHIHESFGVDKIGNTVIMNPGSLAEGRYGILEVEKTGGQWQVTKAQLEKLEA